MVRRDLRGWLGLGGLVLVVIALALIATSRIEDTPSLAGRWALVSIETPEGNFEPRDEAWIEFDGSTFRGHMECIDFDGDFEVSGSNGFGLLGLGSTGGCESFETTTGYAFENYFHQVGVFRVDTDLIMQRVDGSVRFVFTREGAATFGGFRAW